MKRIQDNINKLQDLLNQVKNHCMCLQFEETTEKYMVLLPEGYAVGAVRVDKELGKIKALKIIIEKLEEYWKLW